MDQNHFIIADGRWSGQHGIGRFSTEILARLQHADVITEGPHPLSLQNFFWQTRQFSHYKKKYNIFFTPGFNPILFAGMPFVFTIHDLIHLYAPGNGQLSKKIYYHTLLKPAIYQAHKIITVSEFSKKIILEWATIPAEKVVNVSCGISQTFTATGAKHQPGYPYLLHVGNNSKTHKNVARLLQAFALAKIDPQTRLVFTSPAAPELLNIIQKNHLENRVIFNSGLSETTLAEYYRGADAVVFPSLYEGFGLPVLEGMASGVPVLTSNVTSLPEVASDAAVLIDPFEVDSLTHGIERITVDTVLRGDLIQKGLLRAKEFSWDKSAAQVQTALAGQ